MIFFEKKAGWKCISLVVLISLLTGLLAGGRAEAAGKPARPSISLVKRTATQATIKIKKKGSVTGYHVAVATSKKGKYTIMPTMKRTVKLTKLKKNKVYYVKVRAYRTKGLRIQHGKYSRVLKIGKYKKPQKDPTTPTEMPEETPIPDEFLPPEETPLPDETWPPDAASPTPDIGGEPDAASPTPEII